MGREGRWENISTWPDGHENWLKWQHRGQMRLSIYCPSAERSDLFWAQRVRGFGNKPGEAVELRLKQWWIDYFSLWAGEWQPAWGTQTWTLLILRRLPSSSVSFWIALLEAQAHSQTFTVAYEHTHTHNDEGLCFTPSFNPAVSALVVRESPLAGKTLWPPFLTGLQDTESACRGVSMVLEGSY